MASLQTNKGVYRMLEDRMRGVAVPTNYYVALFTSAVTPSVDIDTKSELTEIATGNGYTAGGIQLTPNATDFDVLTEDDTNDRALVQIKDLVWTASGGPLPTSGNGARYACLTDDNATQGSREIFASFDLSSDRSVSAGQTLTLQNCELQLQN